MTGADSTLSSTGVAEDGVIMRHREVGAFFKSVVAMVTEGEDEGGCMTG